MRKSLVALFKEKFNIPIYWEMVPESEKSMPVGCYVVANDSTVKELDGVGVGMRVCDFAVDILCKDYKEVDRIKFEMLVLSGKTNHRYCDLFQMVQVVNIEDAGAVSDLTTAAGVVPHILSMRISMYE